MIQYIVGIIMGLVFGFSIAASWANKVSNEVMTSNTYLYENNINVNTKSYKLWKIDHEAELEKRKVK